MRVNITIWDKCPHPRRTICLIVVQQHAAVGQVAPQWFQIVVLDALEALARVEQHARVEHELPQLGKLGLQIGQEERLLESVNKRLEGHGI